jgi:NitT/TauT family transport system substrate-binding protein
MRRKRSFGFTLGLVISLLLSSRGGAADRVIGDYGGFSGFQSAVWIAKDLGLFDKYGLDVELLLINGSSRSVAALLSGSTQFATGSATGPLLASSRGSDLVIIGASYNKFPYSIVVKPEIRTPSDLRGKKIGILNFGGSNDLALQLAFKEWGLKRQEVEVIIGGDAPTRLASLMTGRTDGTILSPPHLTRAVKSGYRALVDMGDMRANFSQSTLSVRRSYLRENRDIAKRFLKAYSEAVHVLRTDRARSERVFAKRMRIDDPDMLRETYNYFGPRFSFPPRVDLQGVKDTLEFYASTNAELKSRSPQEFVDHSILDELEKEGFFKSLGS